MALPLSPVVRGEFGAQKLQVPPQSLQTHPWVCPCCPSPPLCLSRYLGFPFTSLPELTPLTLVPFIHPPSNSSSLSAHPFTLNFPQNPSSLHLPAHLQDETPSPVLHPSTWREIWEMERNLALLPQETFANSRKSPTSLIWEAPQVGHCRGQGWRGPWLKGWQMDPPDICRT